MKPKGQEPAGWLSTDTRLSDFEHPRFVTSAETVPSLTLLTHPDLRRIGECAAFPELDSGETVELSRREPLFAAPGGTDSQPLADPRLSRTPIRLVPTRETGPQGGAIRIDRTGNPSPLWIDGEPLAESFTVNPESLVHGVTLELGRHVALLLDRQPALSPRTPKFGLVGESAALGKLRQEIELAAQLDTSVLLRGASGTGKELVARALHGAGPRRDGPWVTVNMAAIPPSLAAAELFGARRGSYTGADRDKPGFFAAAEGGTLFLDEVGDTPPEVQPLLLRALESGEIQPMGSVKTRRVDVRVIAATDSALEGAVAEGRFRAPLLHRLAGWEIQLPTLAERRADIGRLVVHFAALQLGVDPLELENGGPPAWASAPLVGRLARYSWPGNVRQLANTVRRLVILCQADPETPLTPWLDKLLVPKPASNQEVTAHPAMTPAEPMHAEPKVPEEPPCPDVATSPTGRYRPVYRKASEVTNDELRAVLRQHHFDLKPTAKTLGVSRSTLYQLVDRCPGVRTAAQLERGEIEQALARCGDEMEAATQLEVSAHGLKMRIKALGVHRGG